MVALTPPFGHWCPQWDKPKPFAGNQPHIFHSSFCLPPSSMCWEVALFALVMAEIFGRDRWKALLLFCRHFMLQAAHIVQERPDALLIHRHVYSTELLIGEYEY